MLTADMLVQKNYQRKSGVLHDQTQVDLTAVGTVSGAPKKPLIPHEHVLVP